MRPLRDVQLLRGLGNELRRASSMSPLQILRFTQLADDRVAAAYSRSGDRDMYLFHSGRAKALRMLLEDENVVALLGGTDGGIREGEEGGREPSPAEDPPRRP